jgi:hypothetical protein
MRTKKTPLYILHDVHFSGERRQFNAEYEPLFWRGVWLRRDGGLHSASAHQDTLCDQKVPI